MPCWHPGTSGSDRFRSPRSQGSCAISVCPFSRRILCRAPAAAATARVASSRPAWEPCCARRAPPAPSQRKRSLHMACPSSADSALFASSSSSHVPVCAASTAARSARRAPSAAPTAARAPPSAWTARSAMRSPPLARCVRLLVASFRFGGSRLVGSFEVWIGGRVCCVAHRQRAIRESQNARARALMQPAQQRPWPEG